MLISTQTKTKSTQHRREVLLRPLYAGFKVVGLALNGEHQVVASRAIGSKHGNNRQQVDVALAQEAFGQSEQAAWQTAVARYYLNDDVLDVRHHSVLRYRLRGR